MRLPDDSFTLLEANTEDTAYSLLMQLREKIAGIADWSMYRLEEFDAGDNVATPLRRDDCPLKRQRERGTLRSIRLWSDVLEQRVKQRGSAAAAASSTGVNSAMPLNLPRDHLIGKGVVHLHDATLDSHGTEAGTVHSSAAAFAVLQRVQGATPLCATSTHVRTEWLAALTKAIVRPPAVFCAQCRNLVDLSLCKTPAMKELLYELSTSKPIARFLVLALGHLALYTDDAAFGKQMAQWLVHLDEVSREKKESVCECERDDDDDVDDVEKLCRHASKYCLLLILLLRPFSVQIYYISKALLLYFAWK